MKGYNSFGPFTARSKYEELCKVLEDLAEETGIKYFKPCKLMKSGDSNSYKVVLIHFGNRSYFSFLFIRSITSSGKDSPLVCIRLNISFTSEIVFPYMCRELLKSK